MEKKSSGRIKKILITITSILVALALLVVFLMYGTPAPTAYFVRSSFENPSITQLPGYENAESKVNITKDIEYPSKNKDNYADVYMPKEGSGSYPVVLWIHGGAYVGGDKADIRLYATDLASEGYAVVSMNYRRAPEAKYPTPLLQIGEVYEWMKTVAGTYSFDMSRLALAGDSAGAHMMSQFATIQISPQYAALIGIQALVPPETLKAVLLYCGPFDIIELGKNLQSGAAGFVMDRSAWAYFGTKNWLKKYGEVATTINHVTADFPPAFITDGNTASFESHGSRLAEKLKGLGVSVDSYFIPKEVEVTGHEYQFQMDTPAGQQAYAKTTDFLAQHL